MSGFAAKILLDSDYVTSEGDVRRLTTFELTFPRFILPEFNTHRVFSRNSASSRAIPVSKQVKKVAEGWFVPEKFGINQRGMQSHSFLEGEKLEEARQIWKHAAFNAICSSVELLLGSDHPMVKKLTRPSSIITVHPLDSEEYRQELYAVLKKYESDIRNDAEGSENYLNVHKQYANRLLEPFTFHTVIVTATEWNNFFGQRTHKDAQPEIQTIAHMAKKLYDNSVPQRLADGQFHMPLIQEDELEQANANPELWMKVSAGRCARVSYETHDGLRDIAEDLKLFEFLTSSGHMSPLEHIATPITDCLDHEWSGNFRGWKQFRKEFENEDNYEEVLRQRTATPVENASEKGKA